MPFSFEKAAQSNKGTKRPFPRAADIRTDRADYWPPTPVAPPNAVAKKIQRPQLIIAFDVETHDWLADGAMKGRIGEFGFYGTRGEEQLEYQRVISLGWIVGDLDMDGELIVSKEMIVKPEGGFEISAKAEGCHQISQTKAATEGRPLAGVLEEFMRDVVDAYNRGGRVVAHQLEFDASIVKHELGRCRLHDLQQRWVAIAKKGFCTMDPWVCKWVKTCFGHELRGTESEKPIMALVALMRMLVPRREALIARAHQANSDAQMCRLIYIAYLDLANKAERTTTADEKGS